MDSCSQHPILQPEHTVLLSHSGAQKEFVEALYDDLKKFHVYAFFDKYSLPKAEKFADLIKQAAKQCRVAVVVLSKEFLTSKWPMLELDIFVQAKKESTIPRLLILPLFFKISCGDLKDESNLERWRDAWWKAVDGDERMKKEAWDEAVKEIRGTNGEEFKQRLMSEEQFREKVARQICKLATPNLMFDDSAVRGAGRLCEVIVQKFECPPPEKSVAPFARVVGLYGVGGTGKTTLCKMLCNRFSGDFPAKVFHVQLESFRSSCDEMVLERQKKILRELTDETASLVDRLTDADQVGSLQTRKYGEAVFNVIGASYDDLERKTKEIFLDVAVFAPRRNSADWLWPSDKSGEFGLFSWLKAVHRVDEDADIEDRGFRRSVEEDLEELGPAEMVSCLESLFQRGLQHHAINILHSLCWKQNDQEKVVSNKLQILLKRALGRTTLSISPHQWERIAAGVKFVGEATGILRKCMEIPTSFKVVEAILESGEHEEELFESGFTQSLMHHIANQPYRASWEFPKEYLYSTARETSILLEWSNALLSTLRISTKLSQELKEAGTHDLLHKKINEVEQDRNWGRSEVKQWREDVLTTLNSGLQKLE